MINAFSKVLFRHLQNAKFTSLNKKIMHNFASPLIYHRLDIDALSDKWHIDFSYTSCSLVQNYVNNVSKIRPNNFGKVFRIKFIQKSMIYTKGRPEYRMEFLSNEIISLAYWSGQYGKFQIIRSNQYQQEVIIVQKIIKEKPDPAVKPFPQDTNNTQNYPLTLYRFNFYNNKLETQKSKQFFLSEDNFHLFQLTVKSSFNGITFLESKEEYEISKLQAQIVNKSMIINRIDKQE